MEINDALQRVLVVDDSRTALMSVKKVLESAELTNLQSQYYKVSTARSGEEALDLIKKQGLPHLAIVDINMAPKMDGFTFCKKLHAFSDVPVILLTSDDAESTVVAGLMRYAEDYITKPFRSDELKVRVWRVLQRMGDFSYTLEPLIKIDDRLQLNLPERYALIAGNTVSLTPTETKILYILLKNAGRIVRTDFLLRRIWPLEETYEDRLHPHIYRLRKKIEPNPKEPIYIIAEWGVGYTFPPA